MSSPFADPVWWQRLAACLASGQDAVLVTVVRADGSTPRDPGATLLVEHARCTDTLGGGNLELEAIAAARDLLAGGAGQPMVPYTLGPGLRQCCGGAVWLLYEVLRCDARLAGDWAERAQYLQQGGRVLRCWDAETACSTWLPLHEQQGATTRLESRPALHWQQVVGSADFNVRLFGAGHVGRALARVLATTEARLQWIDPRPEAAAEAARLGLPLRCAEEPLDAVRDARAGSWFVVMSHSHTLDFELVEAILRRRDAAFCGLIGSATKAARFRHNLRRQGLDAAAIAGLSCPLGIPDLRDKAPATIAISIAAQLLQQFERQQSQRGLPARRAEQHGAGA